MIKHLRIATRQSPLALWQAQFVATLLKKHWQDLEIELVPMLTSGDQFLSQPLLAVGGKGLFIKELEEALLNKRADIAVHSMKDVPAFLPQGLELFSICERQDPSDALISPKKIRLNQLPEQAIVGTTSLRRQAQLLAYRPDLRVKTLRGNINTRLEKLQRGEYDAIILASAGLKRLNLENLISETLSEELMLPACGQGALGIEGRSGDEAVRALVEVLNHPLSALCVQTERLVSAQLGGNCRAPLAVFCKPFKASHLVLESKVLSMDGRQTLSAQRTGPCTEANTLASQIAAELLAQGAQQLLAAAL